MPDSTVCPDAALLEQFARGLTSAAESARLQRHVANCPACRAALRADLPSSQFDTALSASPPPSGEDATVGDAFAAGAAGDFAFLAPAQGPGEMGRLGPYRVLRVLGAGGMGVVFEAEDPQLERRVALKVMNPAGASQPIFRQRFLREAKAAAKLEHDHVVAVYQVGEDRGVLFLAMPLLRGENLEDRLKREPKPPLAEVLRIGREIALGLAAAHSHGLIHRDIKPSNIWLEEGRGRVKILDFGLARTETDGNQTQEGVVLGTPAFMAPEQARGEALDARCDLFSLGCVLYRMCTGRNPFLSTNSLSLLVAVVSEEPPPPQALDPGLPAPLAQMVTQLLAKKPGDRPASAREVADRLAAMEQGGRTEVLHPVGSRPAARAAARPRRARWLVPVIGVVLLGVLIGAGYRFAPQLLAFLQRPNDAKPGDPDKPSAAAPGTLVIEAEDPGVEVIVRQNGAVAVAATKQRQLELAPGEYDVALAKADAGFRLSPAHVRIEADGASKVEVTAVEAGPKPGDPLSPLALTPRPAPLDGVAGWTVETRSHRGPIRDLAYSSSGRRLATAGADGTVRLWDEGVKLARVLVGHEAGVHAVAWTADGKALASLGDDGVIRVWDPEAGKLLHVLRLGLVRAVAWSPDGTLLAVAGGDRGPDGAEKTARVVNAESGKVVHLLEGHTGEVRFVAWSPDGKTLATAGADHTVRLWEAENGKDLRILEERSKAEPRGLARQAEGKLLAAAWGDQVVHLWELTAAKPAQTWSLDPAGDRTHWGGAVGLTWAPKSKMLAAINGGGLQLWKSDTDKPAHAYPIKGSAVAWSGDGKHLATTNPEEDSAQLADAANGALQATIPDCKQERIKGVFWSPDGKTAALQSERTVWLFRAATGKPAHLLRGPTRDITAVAWSPDGKRLAAAGGWDRQVYVWDAATGKPGRTFTAKADGALITALAWAPDNKTLAIAVDRTPEVPLWDADNGLAAVTLHGHTAAVNAVLWSDDGKTVITGSDDNTMQFWSAETGKSLRTARPSRPHGDHAVTALALAPDGKSLAAGLAKTPDHAGRLFRLPSERVLLNLQGPAVEVGELTWLPDGKTVAARGDDGALRFWDATDGQLTRTIPGRPGMQHFLPERGVGAVGSWALTVRFWDLATARPQTTVELLDQGGVSTWLTTSADGHWQASAGLDQEVVYVERTEAGQKLLTAKEFQAAHGWKNDPDKVALPAVAAGK